MPDTHKRHYSDPSRLQVGLENPAICPNQAAERRLGVGPALPVNPKRTTTQPRPFRCNPAGGRAVVRHLLRLRREHVVAAPTLPRCPESEWGHGRGLLESE